MCSMAGPTPLLSFIYLTSAFSPLPRCNNRYRNHFPIKNERSALYQATEASPIDIPIIDGPFSPELFASTKCWGRKPLLIRSAFDVKNLLSTATVADQQDDEQDDEEEKSWPSWDEVAMLSTDPDGESRLITHRPGDPSSWELQLGPFEEDDVGNILSAKPATSTSEPIDEKWTLVVNDVDRFFPALADWIDEEYQFIPRWRRDDAQISLADIGGGIGPHVDNYDVFLIQMSGRRTWEVGRRTISVAEEYKSMVEVIDVRILSNWEEERERGMVELFELDPGDVLYLPPRIAHCGVALTDACMTLSVGLRAPSANEMVSRIAELMSNDVRPSAYPSSLHVSDLASKRIEDPELLDNALVTFDNGEITSESKQKAKYLIRNALNDYLDREDIWDAIFGKLVTESNRPRFNYPMPLSDGDEEYLGVWGNPQKAVAEMLKGKGALYQAEGIRFGYSIGDYNMAGTKCKGRLFVDGEEWGVALSSRDEARAVLKAITSQRRLDRKALHEEGLIHTNDDDGKDEIEKQMIMLLEELVRLGYLYGLDE